MKKAVVFLVGCLFVLKSYDVGAQAPTYVERDPTKAEHSAIAEIQVGTVIDFGTVIPSGAGLLAIELFGKTGVDPTTNPGDWKTCEVGGQYRCAGLSLGFAQLTLKDTDAGKLIQIRAVPDSGAGGQRARIKVRYQL